MNRLQRLEAALAGHAFGKSLCIPLVFGGAAFLTKVKLKEYLQNGEILAQCQLNSQQKFDYDAVFVYGDNCIEAEALGSKIYFPENAYPYIEKYRLEDPKQLKELPDFNPLTDGRMPELLRAAAFLKAELGDNLPIVGVVLGPMSIASQLMGLERLLYLLLDSPCEFEDIIRFASGVSLKSGLALLAQGAHISAVIDPSSSQSILPSEMYGRYILPHIRAVFSQFKSAGARASWLMITGNSQGLLPYYRQCGVDIAGIDYEVPLEEALKWEGDFLVSGNIKPYRFINKTPQEILREGKELISLAAGRRFILSSGCEIPLDTKPENLAALIKAAKDV
ncbi:uroporphyrinogen decarboxylase family protein [Desulfosporosinus youngiae]|uniref:Uroporphyrinogen-III decarboxylase n=1 Tax=Desulfosporosinus youngiae DSM 17734 TaxID=768710 RepID=H5XXS7_9FIRM|nr:uroporphyrinogen decarboxylase family protein [Desulfosporosinus youngiae]EHQ91356.1 uroporphyrinogen-III decarboxylase [Desulfosporosinus youngiae DSM 17734]